MICISLAHLSFEACLDAVQNTPLAEIRLDLLDLSLEEIRRLFAQEAALIATCRPGPYDEPERKTRLLTAITAGARYVDLEVETPDVFKADILTAARAHGCQVILSYHNFEKTPLRAELDHILTWCEESQPDIIKIACVVNDARDNARLLGLLDRPGQMIVVGMGEQGKITRVVAPLLGSFCTFAAYTAENATAPGQIFQKDLEPMIQQLSQI